MASVGGKNTRPEIVVRRVVHRLGYRFRLHVKDLPGNPDIVLPRHRKAIFVHGCFWHGHDGCRRAARPTTNVEFWNEKLDGNIRRDRRFRGELEALGWRTLVIWECQTKNPAQLERRLASFLRDPAPPTHAAA